jgi:inner membrane transporter RhtA
MAGSIALLILAMVSIQTGASFAKGLFPLAGAAGTTAIRLFFATVILWAVWRPWRMSFKKSDLKNLFVYGASLGLMNLTFYFALERIPLGLAVTLEFVGPLTLSTISSRRKIDFLWVILAAVGIYLVMPQTQIGAATDTLGIVFALVAGMFWAFYIHFGAKAGKDLHGGMATTIGMSFAALVALPFGLVIDGGKLLNPSLLPMGLLVAVLSSALPYSLEMISLKKMPTKTFGILMSLEPAIASLVGLIVLSESLSSIQWLAILCVIVASLGSSISAGEQKTL